MDRSPPGSRTDLPGSSTATQTEVISDNIAPPEPPVLRLQLQRPKSDKKVAWRSGTVDNEDMGKKKSKCCCIYKKPLAFGESSSESEEECEHCYGHVEKRKKNHKHGHHKHDHDGDCPDHGSSSNNDKQACLQ